MTGRRKRRPSRTRVVEVEDCGRCGAPLWAPCVNYHGQRKALCLYRDYCVRCGAQPRQCQCGGPFTGVNYAGEGKARVRLMTQQTFA